MTLPAPRPTLGGPRPSPATDRRALAPYLTVQRAADREMIALLRDTLLVVNRELRRLERKVGIGAEVRADQMRLTKQAIFQAMSDLWREAGDLVRAGRYAAAAASVDSISVYDKVLFSAAGREAEYKLLASGLKAYARNAIDIGSTRLTTSAIQLSRNVYQAHSLANGQLERLLNAMLTRGSSAREIAKEVKGFIDPDVPGGVSYAAMRLGRTELNNAFHAMQANLMNQQPWVVATQWNLSGSHPRADVCDDYAVDVSFNGSPGQYDTGSVPANPHPMCFCFLTPVLMSQDNFISTLNSGAFDSYTDSFS